MNAQMDKIIERLKTLSPKEVLSYAIYNEEEEAKYYKNLFNMAKRESVKILFLQMSEESMKHRNDLYALFKKLYPTEEPVKIDAPPVEVAPFYSKFEKAEDYIEALKYCMESELFAKRYYEILAKKALNKDAKAIFAQLALMEEDHYQRLKKMHELIQSTIDERVSSKLGTYLFEDKIKARYFFLDILSDTKGLVLTRDPPESVKSVLKKDIPMFWITKRAVPNGFHPHRFVDMKRYLPEIVREVDKWSILIEGVGYLSLELGFKNVIDVLTYLRDFALSSNGTVVVHAQRELFNAKEWAILTSEFELIS